jgi:hypothetical protein
MDREEILDKINGRIEYLKFEMGFAERLAGRSSYTYHGLRNRVEELSYFRDIVLSRAIEGFTRILDEK